MLNKILLFLLTIPFAAAAWLGYRYSQNPESVVPWPYKFQNFQEVWTVEAPILLSGDRMMIRLNQYNAELSLAVSHGLEKTIKIDSLAKENENIHRTLHRLKNLQNWPPVVIYHGSSEEGVENIFYSSEIKKIKDNFTLFQNETYQTLMTLYPWLSRIFYSPFKHFPISQNQVAYKANETETEFMSRMEMVYLLFEQALREMIRLSKEKNAVLVLVTTPINLDIKPKKVCSLSNSEEINIALTAIRTALKEEDYKTAYQSSLELSQASIANAEVLYVFGQVASRMGKNEEAEEALLKAASYECSLYRSNEVFNSIIRKVSQEERVTLFDFSQFMNDQRPNGEPFFDEIYPQNVHYEKAMNLLGIQVKKILKI